MSILSKDRRRILLSLLGLSTVMATKVKAENAPPSNLPLPPGWTGQINMVQFVSPSGETRLRLDFHLQNLGPSTPYEGTVITKLPVGPRNGQAFDVLVGGLQRVALVSISGDGTVHLWSSANFLGGSTEFTI